MASLRVAGCSRGEGVGFCFWCGERGGGREGDGGAEEEGEEMHVVLFDDDFEDRGMRFVSKR